MPRLPTIRVIGSHAISTSPLASLVLVVAIGLPPLTLVAGRELRAGCPPLRFLVDGLGGDAPQPADRAAVDAARHRRDARAGRFVHERHELVGEAGHRAPDADAADVRTPTDAVDPAALGYVALHHRAPAPELHDALRRAVLGREVALLVVPGAVAALVHGGAEQPLRSQRVVERDHRRLTGGLVQEVEDGLREVVGVHRAPGHA